MARRPRRESESGVHHVMNRGADRQPVFFTALDRIAFLRRLSVVCEEQEVKVLAYCLLDNHFHLLVRAPDVGALSAVMKDLIGPYTQWVNDRLGRDGALFRGRFHSIPVETDDYFLWVARYIHLNALDVRGVTSPAEYRWSSYPAYLGLCPAPEFLDVHPVMALLGGRRRELVALTEGDGAHPGSPSSPTAKPAQIATVVGLVRCALAVEDLTREPRPGGHPRLVRTVLVLLASRAPEPDERRRLADALDLPPGRAGEMVHGRAQKRLQDDPVVERVLAFVEDGLGHRREPRAA